MADMTDEEYDALDEKWTKNPPNVGPNGTGFFAKRRAEGKASHFVLLDDLSAAYLEAKARADHKTPGQIIGEWAREKIASASEMAAV